MRICHTKAAEAGIPLFLCAVPSARDFYAKLGFEERVVLEIELSDFAPRFSGFGAYRFYGMMKAP